MKKSLLFVAALAASVCANAQLITADGAAMGLTTEATAVAAGTLVGENDNVKLSIAFEDNYKIVSLGTSGHSKFVFDGNESSASSGLQGNTNPKDINSGNPDATLMAPATGAVLQIEAKVDGYVYVFGKLSTNKSYTVFEEGTAIGYQLVMEPTTDKWTQGGLLDLTVVGEGELNEVKNPITWPEVMVTGTNVKPDDWAAIGASGMGVIKFPVFADCKYLVNAVGSKISFGGCYFDKEGDVKVSLAGDAGEVVLLAGDPNNISSTVVGAEVVATEYFTVAGQQIAAPVKGINLVKQTLANGAVKTVKVIF